MTRLLIVEAADGLRLALRESLEPLFDLRICSDGSQALMALREFEPDILVLDLDLAGLDGLALLHHVRLEGRSPTVLVLCTLVSEYVLQELEKLGVDYLMRKPIRMDVLVNHALRLAELRDPGAGRSSERIVSDMLLALGFLPQLSGTMYLHHAVMLLRADPTLPILKVIYPRTAQKYGVPTPEQVERCIRTAIHKAWEHHNVAVWSAFLPVNDRGEIPRPSSGMLIQALAHMLRLEENQMEEQAQRL